jgi:hypothetical protein
MIMSRKLVSLVAFVLLLLTGGEAFAVIGRPLTPLSFAGVARRSARRTYGYGWRAAPYTYRAAPYAYMGTPAAVATLAPYGVSRLPAGCVPGGLCHGHVYRPYYSGSTVVYGY